MTDRPGEDLTDRDATPRPIPAGEPVAIVRVALPTEHGGWSLTLEPALLGLLVAPSWAGAALALAAFVAFVARTPLKWVLVDRWRRRRLPRTALAEKVAVIELGLLAALIAAAAVTAQGPFWIPLAFAAPLVAAELWFDMRSRSRRLLPELAGAVGIASIVAAIVLADGERATLAIALWALLAARSIAAIPFVRVQLQRRKHQTFSSAASDLAQGTATVVAVIAVVLDGLVLAGFVGFLVLVAYQVVAVRRPPPPAAIIGSLQLALGLALIAVTAVGVIEG